MWHVLFTTCPVVSILLRDYSLVDPQYNLIGQQPKLRQRADVECWKSIFSFKSTSPMIPHIVRYDTVRTSREPTVPGTSTFFLLQVRNLVAINLPGYTPIKSNQGRHQSRSELCEYLGFYHGFMKLRQGPTRKNLVGSYW